MNLPEYAVFLGVDDDGWPVLVDAHKRLGILFGGGIDFDLIESMTKYLGSRVEFVRITADDLCSDVGWQKMFALGAWIRAGRARNHVLMIDSLEHVERMSLNHKRQFASLFEQVTILAITNRRTVLGALFEDFVVGKGDSFEYQERSETRRFRQVFTLDKVLEIEE